MAEQLSYQEELDLEDQEIEKHGGDNEEYNEVDDKNQNNNISLPPVLPPRLTSTRRENNNT